MQKIVLSTACWPALSVVLMVLTFGIAKLVGTIRAAPAAW